MAKIYLSSTYNDLKACREAVYHVLRQMKHDVIAMEDYVATDQRPLDMCLADVAACDLYIGIFAWCYGYIPQRDNSELKSITELEYRKAIETGKPTMLFLLDKNTPWPITETDMFTGNGNRGQLIRALREELAQSQMVSFFETSNNLASLISAAVINWEKLYSVTIVSNTIRTIPQTIEFSIQWSDITSFDADVIALKQAPGWEENGELIRCLNKAGINQEKLRPRVNEYCYVETKKCTQARHVLFIGVPNIKDFTYKHIQEFSASVLATLAYEAPDIRHLVMTIQEVNTEMPLDEIEGFLAQFNGYLDALAREQLPVNLECITVLDKDEERVKFLRQTFEEHFDHLDYVTKVVGRWAYKINIRRFTEILRETQKSARPHKRSGKQHVFVAMPFLKDMDDVYYYGILQSVRAAGFICERIDQEAFTGDILDQVKQRIETAAVVIAELSGANPNVYLEVGYAWGKERPTILLLRNTEELRFDVRGQRCLVYERIRDLEESLNKLLEELKSKRLI